MGRPSVSVVIPAYNAEATIRETLDSLLRQTCRDVEIVVIDDGSTDATARIVEQVASHSEIPLRLTRQSNLGRAAARNRGVDEAAGEFLGFVDADDTVEPTMFEKLLAKAEETAADMVVCEYADIDSATGLVTYTYREGDASLYGGSVLEHPGLLSSIAGSVCNKIVRRSLFGEVRFPAHRDFEDLATVFRLMGEARRIEKVPEVLYAYKRGHASSIMSAHDERYLQVLDSLAITNDHFVRSGDFEALHDDLLRINYTHAIVGRMSDLLRRGSRTTRHQFIELAFEHMDRYFPGWRRNRVVRAASGHAARRMVSTSKPMLILYADVRSSLR